MTNDTRPPRLVTALLQYCLPDDVSESIVGDLEEEWRARNGVRGTIWFTLQALAIGIRFLPSRWQELQASKHEGGGRWDRFLGRTRFAFRVLARQPAWTFVCVLTLSTGIGLATTAFSIVYGSVYRGLPIQDAHRLVHFERENLSQNRNLAVSSRDYVAWLETQTSFEDLGAYTEAVLTLVSDDGSPERATGIFISANSFRLLRTQTSLGRLFDESDERPGAPPVILIGHGVWQSRFGSDSDVVGRSLRVNGEPTTVVGVMPNGFGFPVSEQYWLPLRRNVPTFAEGAARLDVFGRLRDEADLTSARAEFETIGRALERAHPDTNTDISPKLVTFADEYLGEEFPKLMLTLFAGALFVLLIACANVGSLLSTQAVRRSSEMAVRRAIGASRAELLAQRLTETVILSLIAASLGIFMAKVGLEWFNHAWGALADLGLPHGADGLFWWRFELDTVPLAFVLAVTVGSALLLGLFSLFPGRRTSLAGVLRSEASAGSSRRAERLGSTLVVVEVALTTALVLAASLTVESLLNLTRVDYGLAVDDVFTARIGLPDDRYPDDSRRRRFWAELTEALNATPGFEAVTAATTLPMRVSRATALAVRGGAGHSDDLSRVRTSTVSSDFFETYDVKLIEGRTFQPTDRASGLPVAIVNESFRRRYFPRESALNRQIRVGHEDSDEPFRTIVGVVPNLWMDGSRGRRAEGVYLPLSQSRSPYGVGLRYLSVAVRAPLTDTVVAERLRDVVATIDPELAVYDAVPMEVLVANGTGRYRVYGTFYVGLGIVALALASLGLYGVLSFHVANSTADIGIRMALGSSRTAITGLYLGRGLRQVVAGTAIGVLVSAWFAAGLQRALFEVELWNTTSIVGVSLVLGMTATLACYLPARRASQVPPMQATRL